MKTSQYLVLLATILVATHMSRARAAWAAIFLIALGLLSAYAER